MLNATMIINLFHKIEKIIMSLSSKHPIITFILLLIGTPMLLLGVIFLCTTMVMMPLSALMGWI